MVGRALMGTMLALALAGCGGSTTTVTQTSTVTQTRTETRTVVKRIAVPRAKTASDYLSTYPATFKSSFMHSCLAHGSTAECQCAVQQIQSTVAFETVLKDAQDIQAGRLPSWYQDALLQCAGP